MFNQKFREYIDMIEFEEVDLDKDEEKVEEDKGGQEDEPGQAIKLGQLNKDATFFMRSFIQLRVYSRYRL